MSAVNINFSVYPTTNRVPGVFAEVDNSKANSGQVNQRALIFGQMLSSGTAGTAAANIPVISTGVGAGQALYGHGSMLALEIAKYRGTDDFGELWVVPLSDDGTAVAATGTITPAGPATGPGTLFLYIAGQRVTVGINTADTAIIMGASIAAAIAAAPDLPVSALASGTTGVVTLTAKNKCLSTNDIDLRVNYLGTAGGEALPSGVTLTFSAMTGGTVNPSLTAALANLAGDQTFDFIICPYNDTATLNALQTFLNDLTGRWSWTQELFGGFFFAFRGTLGAQTTFGTGRNDQHASCIGFFDSPTPHWLWAPAYGAACAVSLRADPAQPLQTLVLDVAAPPLPSRFDIGERNTLLYDGISTFVVDDSNTVRIDRAITTFQKNASGAPDDSYLDVETMYTLQFAIRDMRIYLQSQFPRMKLVSDGTKIPFGSNMVTSKTVLASAIARYRQQCTNGLMQNPDQFAQQAQSQNAGGGRVNLLLPFQLANQLRQIAMLVQFTKP